MAASQVIQAGVGDQGAVVQLQHNQVLTGAGGQAQVPGKNNVWRNVSDRSWWDNKASFLILTYLMASSVMSSQWESERDSRQGQWADSWGIEQSDNEFGYNWGQNVHLGDGVISNEDTLLQVHPLQLVARSGESLEHKID